jgi:hypothetical protein
LKEALERLKQLLEVADVLGTLETERLIESRRELVPLDEVS